MPDPNTLRFAAPLLPAGSSNSVVIRYADGEVVTLPLPLKSMALVPNSPTDTDKDGLKDWWELTYGLDPNNAADATTVQANGHDTDAGAEHAAPPDGDRDALPRGGLDRRHVPDADRAGEPERAAGHRAAAVSEGRREPGHATGRGAGDGPHDGGCRGGGGHGDGRLRDDDRVGPAVARRSNDAVDRDGALREPRGARRDRAGDRRGTSPRGRRTRASTCSTSCRIPGRRRRPSR